VPKEVFKIEGFHGGLNSNSDPRDIRQIESPSIQDVAIDSVGKIKTLGSTVASTADGNTTSILKNRGLFTMSSDRQLDGDSGDETLIFLHDNVNHTIDVNDSGGWDTDLINMGGSSIPIYYTADGVIRVSDASLTQNSQWFGYISDVRFSSLNAVGPAAGWVNVEQSLETPTSGHCLISTPAVGSDSNGIFSSASEYIGNVIDDGGSGDVVDHSAVNLRVGVQFNEIIAQTHIDIDSYLRVSNPLANSTDIYPCMGLNTTKIVGQNASEDNSRIQWSGLAVQSGENDCFILSMYIQGDADGFDKLESIAITITPSSGGSVIWRFSKQQLKPDMWNLLVCASDNISQGSTNFPFSSDVQAISLLVYDNASSGGAAHKMDYYISAVVLATFQSIQAFTPNTYTFHHTYLYDVENKQESLPFKFNNISSDGTPDDVNAINVVGSSVLFNFDTYICSNVSAGNAYGLNKRISGSRLYYKVEENDNYFLIGELDFVEKGFKFIPEADTLSYTMSNTSNTTGNILSKTALIKEISPDSANTIDTFKTINGFSTEVKSLDAKYKTAVVHGRRVYIGNIKRPDGKTYPDRIIKSQVNRFDTFPEGMGSVDVVIRDGENIVKLEAYADRILQFKEHSLYIINVSESVDFLEDTFRNKGCAFDYHVVRTDLGIAWFNDHGCYLYDGKSVIHLLEKQGVRLISEDDWSLFVKDGTDDLDMSSAMIGYVPKKKHLIIKNENNDIYLYDFVLQAWTTGDSKVTESTAMTNFALDKSQNLFYIDNTTTIRKTWIQDSKSTDNLLYKTPDMDFGQPSIRKKIYRVRINYKGDASALGVFYATNGDTDTIQRFEGTRTSDGKPTGSENASPLHNKTDLTQWHQAELKPSTIANTNNIYSFQFVLTGTAGSDFEVNDITIVYRMKNIK